MAWISMPHQLPNWNGLVISGVSKQFSHSFLVKELNWEQLLGEFSNHFLSAWIRTLRFSSLVEFLDLPMRKP